MRCSLSVNIKHFKVASFFILLVCNVALQYLLSFLAEWKFKWKNGACRGPPKTWIQNSCASLQKGISWFCLISAKSYRPTSCKSLGENEHEYWCMHAPWSHLQSALIFYPLKSRRCKSHQESPWQPDITGCWTMAVISWECWQSRVELQVAVINI